MKRGPKILIVCLVAWIMLAFGATTAGVYFTAVYFFDSVDSVLWWKPSAEECLRIPLPAGSRVVAESGSIPAFGGSRWFVIEMSRDQFDQFKAAGGFAHRPDLLSYWPASLWPPERFGHPACPWVAHPVNDEFTVYRQVNGTMDVGRWEDGRLFYKHHVS